MTMFQNEPCPICGEKAGIVGQGLPWRDDDGGSHAGEPIYGWSCHSVQEMNEEWYRRALARSEVEGRENERQSALEFAWEAGAVIRIEVRDELDPDAWQRLSVDQEARRSPGGTVIVRTGKNPDLDRLHDHYYAPPVGTWRVLS